MFDIYKIESTEMNLLIDIFHLRAFDFKSESFSVKNFVGHGSFLGRLAKCFQFSQNPNQSQKF